MDALVATLVSGLVLGSLYALMSSGLSLVWTTLGVFNFAHGALMMVGAFIAWTISEPLGLGPIVGVLGGALAAGVVGIVIERLLVRPFYNDRNMLLITAMTAALAAHGGLLLTALLAAGFSRFTIGLWPAIVTAAATGAWALLPRSLTAR